MTAPHALTLFYHYTHQLKDYACWCLDTEGSFMLERSLQIAEACIEDMSGNSDFLQKDFQSCQVKAQPKDFLQNIFYFRVCSYTEQIAMINYLDKFISEHKDVGTIIFWWFVLYTN